MRANRRIQESLWMISNKDKGENTCEVLTFDRSKKIPNNNQTEVILNNTRGKVINLFT